ncbi:MAG: hypothetical protein ABI239_11220 [Aquihabitans sp.]
MSQVADRRAAVALPMAIGLVLLLLLTLTVSFRSWWLPLTLVTISGLLELVRRMPSVSWRTSCCRP